MNRHLLDKVSLPPARNQIRLNSKLPTLLHQSEPAAEHLEPGAQRELLDEPLNKNSNSVPVRGAPEHPVLIQVRLVFDEDSLESHLLKLLKCKLFIFLVCKQTCFQQLPRDHHVST